MYKNVFRGNGVGVPFPGGGGHQASWSMGNSGCFSRHNAVALYEAENIPDSIVWMEYVI
jgi:hypothetical protein